MRRCGSHVPTREESRARFRAVTLTRGSARAGGSPGTRRRFRVAERIGSRVPAERALRCLAFHYPPNDPGAVTCPLETTPTRRLICRTRTAADRITQSVRKGRTRSLNSTTAMPPDKRWAKRGRKHASRSSAHVIDCGIAVYAGDGVAAAQGQRQAPPGAGRKGDGARSRGEEAPTAVRRDGRLGDTPDSCRYTAIPGDCLHIARAASTIRLEDPGERIRGGVYFMIIFAGSSLIAHVGVATHWDLRRGRASLRPGRNCPACHRQVSGATR